MSRPHQNLEVWKEAMRLVRMTYEATQGFPKEEMYGLCAQMRRAAVSVPSNIAEGAARSTKKELAQFVNIAKGSLSELETQLLISADLGFLDKGHEIYQCAERVAKLLAGFHRRVTTNKPE